LVSEALPTVDAERAPVKTGACAACGAWWLPGAQQCSEHCPQTEYIDGAGDYHPPRAPPEVFPRVIGDGEEIGFLVPKWPHIFGGLR
jgi:hypothetical protein